MQLLFFILYLFSIIALGLFSLHKLFLLYTYHKVKGYLPGNPHRPAQWPEVTVQLPVFNERFVVKRLIRSVAQMRYPRNKLIIQILDDSTDDTSDIIRHTIARYEKKGYRIQHIRRPNREGFKAGALAHGMRCTRSGIFAIFDADFVPPPDFLQKSVPYLLQPGIGMVQTRWAHINRHHSLLTRLQAIFLDGHFIIEHTARNRSGRFFNFNGTAGLWKRQAIEDAGGWQHNTLTEDLDLSYRAQLAGWNFLYLPHITCSAELPIEMNAYKNQQHRWAKGSVQTALKLYPHLWGSPLPYKIRLEAFLHLGSNLSYLLMAIPAILILPALKFQMQLELGWFLYLYFLLFSGATVSVMMYYGTVIKEEQKKLWPGILYIPALMALGMGLSLNNGKAALEALLGYQSEFKRTPKYGAQKRGLPTHRKLYAIHTGKLHLLELLLAGYFAFGIVEIARTGIYTSIPFFLLFLSGFAYIGLSSVRGKRRTFSRQFFP